MKKDDDYALITKIVTDIHKFMNYNVNRNYFLIGFIFDVLVLKQEKWNM